MKKILTTAVLLFAAALAAKAQYATPAPKEMPAVAAETAPATDEDETEYAVMDLTVDNYTEIALPPLHVLLRNAKERSTQVNMFTAKREEQERELKTLRRSWLKYIKLNSTFSYGSTDTNNQVYYQDLSPTVQNVTGTTQRWWSVGASISLPLEEIFNRNNKLKQQRHRIASVQYEIDTWYDEVCLEIIDRYTTAAEQLSIIGDMARSLITAQAQYAATEIDYINGQIDEAALSFQKNIENTNMREFAQMKKELTRSLLQLEVLSKTPLISRPVTPETGRNAKSEKK